MRITTKFDDKPWGRALTKLQGFESKGRAMFAESLNEGGEAMRRQTVIAETGQTNLPKDAINRAQHEIAATANRLTFTIMSRGGNVRLKYFDPKEGPGGVTANPWGRSSFYAQAFMTSGRAPNRAIAPGKDGKAGLNGQVYTAVAGMKRVGGKVNARPGKGKSVGSWYRKMVVERSGLYIPEEMTKGGTLKAFEKGADAVMGVVLTKLEGMLD